MEHKIDRQKVIVRASIIGIIVNIGLVIIKTILGMIAGSIAILLDALNNLTDVVSSVVTILGLFFASKKPDEDHPLGHGRFEYISAGIVAIIIIYAGITAGKEAFVKLLNPTETVYSVYTVIMLVTTIITKFMLGTFVKDRGQKYSSSALVASGLDAINDGYVSCTVLFSAILYLAAHIQIDAIVGILISVIIIKSGVELLLDDLKDILGRRPERELTESIKDFIREDKSVIDVHDLILHNYGPQSFLGSVVVDIDANMSADEIDIMSHRIKDAVLEKFDVILNGIGICSMNSEHHDMRLEIVRRLEHIDHIIQVHGIHIDEESKSVNLDIIIDFDDKYPDLTLDHAKMHLTEAFPEYTFKIHKDSDI